MKLSPRTFALIATLATIASSPASAMTVAEFLVKADALEKKGMAAMFSSDIGLLKAEIQAAAKALRAEQNIAASTGRPPATCMPKPVRFKNRELLASFRSIATPQRRQGVKDGFARFIRTNYPCPH